MGHMPAPEMINVCARQCEARGVRTLVVLSVRDPYGYWSSLYRYNWAGGWDFAGQIEALGISMDRASGALRSMPLERETRAACCASRKPLL
mgnify:CR=1 FL=1